MICIANENLLFSTEQIGKCGVSFKSVARISGTWAWIPLRTLRTVSVQVHGRVPIPYVLSSLWPIEVLDPCRRACSGATFDLLPFSSGFRTHGTKKKLLQNNVNFEFNHLIYHPRDAFRVSMTFLNLVRMFAWADSRDQSLH